MNLVTAQSEIGSCGDAAFVNTTFPTALCNLTACLRRVIFISEAALSGGFDLQRICLRAVTWDNKAPGGTSFAPRTRLSQTLPISV